MIFVQIQDDQTPSAQRVHSTESSNSSAGTLKDSLLGCNRYDSAWPLCTQDIGNSAVALGRGGHSQTSSEKQMGGSNAKIAAYSMPVLIRRIGQADLPEDRNLVIDFMSQIDGLLLIKKSQDIYFKQFKKSEGMRTIIKATKIMIEDLDAVSYFVQIVESIKLEVDLMLDLIQCGGLELMDKALKIHIKDDYLAVLLPKIVKVVLAVGAASSIDEIRHEGVNLKLCRTCQEIIEREKTKLGSTAKISIPKSSERVNRILKFMENYMPRVDVQMAGLDAVINFSRNADAKTTTMDTDIVAIVTKSMEKHIEEPGIIWRGCMIFNLLASYQQEVAVDIALTMIHEKCIESYRRLKSDPLIRQQILWLLAALAQWPRSHRIMHKSQLCVDFIKNIVEGTFEEDVNPTKRMDEENDNQPTAEQDEEDDASKQNTTTIPIQLRKFHRDSGGKTYRKPKDKSGKQVIKVRRNYDELPKYGTVDDRIFTKGEEGLVVGPDGEDEDEHGNKKKDAPEWQKFLNNRDTQLDL